METATFFILAAVDLVAVVICFFFYIEADVGKMVRADYLMQLERTRRDLAESEAKNRKLNSLVNLLAAENGIETPCSECDDDDE